MFRRLKAPSLSTLGLQQFVFDLGSRRYRHRQFVTIAYLVLLTILGTPDRFAVLFWPGAALVFIGESIRLWASGHVKKDRVLAVTGPYAFVRHPLYLGNHSVVLGFCLACGLWWSFPVWIALSFAFYPSAIRREDALLHRVFGSEWEDWRDHVRALIPRFSPYRSGPWSRWSLVQSLQVNGEPLIAAFLFGCLYLLYLRIA
ncbi:MAG: methyltransferase family protein [Acidiferrobacterales bacterium]